MSEILSPSGEAAWQSLRQHIEWTRDFWVGWLFLDHPPSGHELHHRMAELVRGQGRHVALRQPFQPQQLTEILTWLLAKDAASDGCATVMLSRQTPVWDSAWTEFLHRLNERRDLLREQRSGGVLLILPTAFKAKSRAAAPDLWSIRALALDVAPPVWSSRTLTLDVDPSVWSSGALALDVDPRKFPGPWTELGACKPALDDTQLVLADQALAAAKRAGRRTVEIEARLRRARALFAENRGEQALAEAARAVDDAPDVALRTRALETLGDLSERLGDLVGAEQHYRAAVGADAEAVSAWALRDLASVVVRRGATDDAVAFLHAALARSSRDHAAGDDGATYQRLRALKQLGGVQKTQRAWAAAAENFDEALRLVLQRREATGETEDSLHDEAMLRVDIGDLLRELGNWPGAHAEYDTALARIERARDVGGDTPKLLADEAVCHERLGALSGLEGDYEAALHAHETSLRLQRHVRELLGDRPEFLLNEAINLAHLGKLHSVRDLDAAGTAYEAALGLLCRVRVILGDTSRTLMVEISALMSLGGNHIDRGDAAAAATAFAAARALAQRLREFPGAAAATLLSDAWLAVKAGDALAQRGTLEAAAAAYAEALALARRARASEDTPLAAACEAMAIEKSGDAAFLQQDWPAALTAYTDCRALRCTIDTGVTALRNASVLSRKQAKCHLIREDLAAAAEALARAQYELDRFRLVVGDTLEVLGDSLEHALLMASLHIANGEVDMVKAAITSALAAVRTLRDRTGDTRIVLESELRSLLLQGELLRCQGERVGAIAAFESTLDCIRKFREKLGDTALVGLVGAQTCLLLAVVELEQGHLRRTLAFIARARVFIRDIAGTPMASSVIEALSSVEHELFPVARRTLQKRRGSHQRARRGRFLARVRRSSASS